MKFKKGFTKTRIFPHSRFCPYGYYVIQRLERFACFFWTWKTIYRFLGGTVGQWNPHLLQYDEACEFAKKMMSNEEYEAYQKENIENSIAWSKKPDAIGFYPVDLQEFDPGKVR